MDEEERARHQSRQKLLTRLLILGLTVLAAIAIVYYFYSAQYEIDHAEVRIIQYEIE